MSSIVETAVSSRKSCFDRVDRTTVMKALAYFYCSPHRTVLWRCGIGPDAHDGYIGFRPVLTAANRTAEDVV